MTKEEAIHKLEYSKKAYQKLIDEKVDSGKLVGDGVRGEWKAEAPLDEAYKDMIEALDMAIKALEQETCEDCISRQTAINALGECPMVWTDSDAEITAERDWKDTVKMLKRLPPVTLQPKIGHWILLDECSNSGYYCSECHKKVIKEGWSNTVKKVKYCPNCGARMEV